MHRRTADVVVPVFRDPEVTWACLESVLEHSGEALGTVIVVEDASPDPQMRPMLRALRDREPRVRLIENDRNLGFVHSCNLGLSLRRGHAVVLNSDTRVTPGWLAELLAVLDEDPRVAAVCPLSNNATLCSVPEYVVGSPPEALTGVDLPLAGLPRWTAMPTGVGFCLLLRDEALALLGPFDPAYGRGYHEENDWCQRAQAHGLLVARANHAFVFHLGQVSFAQERDALDVPNARRLVARYPTYLDQNRSFDQGPQARVAASAVRSVTGRVRVCLDVGGGVRGAWEAELLGPLLTALAQDARFELTVRPADDAARQALPPDAPLMGGPPFDVVHRVGPVDDLATLQRLVAAPGHLVLEWPGGAHLVAPQALGTWQAAQVARACHWALAGAAQRIVVDTRAQQAALLREGDVLAEQCVIAPPLVPEVVARREEASSVCVFDDAALGACLGAVAGESVGEVVVLEGPWPASRLAVLPAGARRLRAHSPAEALAGLAGAAVLLAPLADGLRARLALGALAAGVPVVTTDFAALAELGGAGVVVAEPGEAALAAAVARKPAPASRRASEGGSREPRARAAALTRAWLEAVRAPSPRALSAHGALAGLLRPG